MNERSREELDAVIRSAYDLLATLAAQRASTATVQAVTRAILELEDTRGRQ